MLTIHPTEHLTGLTVSGDYWDLDDIIQAIHEIVGEEMHYFHYEGARKRLLKVCAKMRQAAKGEHDIHYIANGINKNAIKIFREKDDDLFVIGGQEIYSLFLPFCDTAYITKIYADGNADKYIMNFDMSSDWQLDYKSDLFFYDNISFDFNNDVGSHKFIL